MKDIVLILPQELASLLSCVASFMAKESTVLCYIVCVSWIQTCSTTLADITVFLVLPSTDAVSAHIWKTLNHGPGMPLLPAFLSIKWI